MLVYDNEEWYILNSAGYSKFDNNPLEVDDGRAATEDEEYARIYKRMAELEKEEEEAEKADESDEDDDEQLQGHGSTDQETEEESEKADESDNDDEQLQREISNDQEADVQIQRQIPSDREVRSTLV